MLIPEMALLQVSGNDLQLPLVIAALVAFLINIAALFGLGLRVGRFEGRVDSKLETIEQRQATSVSSESASALRDAIARIEKQLERFDDEKVSEHRVRNIIIAYAEEIAKAQRGGSSRGRDL